MRSWRALQVGAAAAAVASLWWAAAGSSWHYSNGNLSAAGCFAIACALAAVCVAAAAGTGYREAAAWVALAAVGQAASLQLIDAGPRLHYQHYPPLAVLFATHPAMLVVIGVQTAVVAAALMRYSHRRAMLGQDSELTIHGPRLVLALLLSVCTAATVSPSVPGYLAELAFAASLQIIAIATIFLAALAVPLPSLLSLERRLTRLFGTGEVTEVRLDRFSWVAAAFVVLLAVTLNVASYERHPHVPDEVTALLQARYFADGMATMPLPAVPAAFDVDLMTYESTRWFSPLSPGWSAVLALGVLIGAPWLVNPVLAGLNILLTYLLLQHLYTRREARWAVVLLAVSPWFLFMGMSFMTHMLTLACGLTTALALVRAQRTGSFGWGMLAGAAVGAATLVRPLDGAVIGLLAALCSLGVAGRRLNVAALSGVGMATIVVTSIVLPYNSHLTGHPLAFPVNAYFDRYYHPNANAYGFGPDRGVGWAIDPNPGHSFVDGSINSNLNTFSINTDLFGWSTGSLIFVAAFVCFGKPTRSDRLMLAIIGAVVLAYFFYYFSGGPDFGARYWFVIVVPLVALTVRGIQVIEPLGGARVGFAVVGLMALTLVNFVPWRAIDKYHHFRGMRADVRALASEQHFGRDLVLVRGDRFPDYESAATYNPIDLAGPATVYAWDRDPSTRAEILRAYPDRRVWLVDGPSVTGSGFRIVEGPLSATALGPEH